jgi:hypothetical protein
VEDRTFDGIARVLARASSRRGAIGAALALIGAGAVPVAGVAAKPKRGTCRPVSAGCTSDAQCCSRHCDRSRNTPRNRRNRCACSPGTVQCGQLCVDTDFSFGHCGGCGVACDHQVADLCFSGVCSCNGEPACVNGEICADGGCRPPSACWGAPDFCADINGCTAFCLTFGEFSEPTGCSNGCCQCVDTSD